MPGWLRSKSNNLSNDNRFCHADDKLQYDGWSISSYAMLRRIGVKAIVQKGNNNVIKSLFLNVPE